MIPEHLRSVIANRLVGLGGREDVAHFLYCFAALESDRDTEYALEQLKESDNEGFKRAVHIVLEEIVADKGPPKQEMPKDYYLVFCNHAYPIPKTFDNEADAIAEAEKAFADDWNSKITVILNRVIWTKSK